MSKNISLSLLLIIFSWSLSAQCLNVDMVVSLATCGMEDGTVAITPLNGVGPYTYSWLGNTEQAPGAYTVTGLPVGFHTINITDANNCATNENVNIYHDSDFQIDAVTNWTFCEGDCFELYVEIAGGCPPYNYAWIGPNGFSSTTSTPFACDAGIYEVIVSDCNGCQSVIDNIELVGTSPLGISIQGIQNTVCSGSCSGSADITAFGGLPPYTFNWSNGQTTQDATGLCAGFHNVTVWDSQGCITEMAITIECAEIVIDTDITWPTCLGSCDGAITATATGGTPPYTYNWNTGATTPTITGLCAGIYQVTVVDALNFAASNFADTIAYQNNLLIDVATTGITCTMGGSIEISVLNGSGDYSYDLNGVSYPSNIITGLTELTYDVQVIDNVSGCAANMVVNLSPPFDLEISTTEANCDTDDGTATATVNNSTSTYAYAWSNGATTSMVTGLAPGGYSVTITDDANGCTVHDVVLIYEENICFTVIAGYVIDDSEDMNCVPDMNSDSIPMQLVALNGTQFTFTDAQGFFSFEADPGTYTLTYESQTLLYDPLCTDPISVTTTTFGETTLNNFYVQENEVVDLRLYVVKTAIRPGFEHNVYMDVFNAANAVDDGVLTFTHDANQNFDFGVPAPTSYDPVARLITWDIGDMEVSSNKAFRAQFTTDPSLPLGTEITMSGIVTPITGDIYPENNEINCTEIVTGSYDPNDKSVSHDGDTWELDDNIIWPNSTNELRYLVRFQNTGTDTAFTVVIEDELDAKIDIRNITPGPSSHPYTLDVRDGNVLEFTFNNILLPDSTTNLEGSNGHVFFDVFIPDDFPLGQEILNDAAIFFDYNAPIITNEVTTTFDYWLATEEFDNPIDLQLFPNPTNGVTTLSFDLLKTKQTSIKLFDIHGKMIHEIMPTQLLTSGIQQHTFNTKAINPGTYIVQIQSGQETTSTRLVILK